MKVKDILKFLDQKFPISTACDFDNVGLLVGDIECEVEKAVIALDCTLDAIKTAVQNNCQLIITHHPVIFDPLKSVLKGSIVYEVIRNNLSVISMHTNLDVGVGGVNDSLCEYLSPLSVETVIASDGYALKKCTISPTTADSLAESLKSTLGGCIKYADCKKEIKTVLVCSGSGGGFINEVAHFGCDALLTADVKHNHFLEAQRLGVCLFDAGHFNTEDIVVEPLKAMLQKEFQKIEFITNHESVIKNR